MAIINELKIYFDINLHGYNDAPLPQIVLSLTLHMGLVVIGTVPTTRPPGEAPPSLFHICTKIYPYILNSTDNKAYS